jgi:hypothetical protein
LSTIRKKDRSSDFVLHLCATVSPGAAKWAEILCGVRDARRGCAAAEIGEAMNRRGFLGAVSAVFVAPAVGSTKLDAPATALLDPPLQVKRADGMRYIVGIATETVNAGDFVQIQTSGPARMTMT